MVKKRWKLRWDSFNDFVNYKRDWHKKRNRVIIELEKNRYEKHIINRSYYHCNCNDLYECNIKNISSRAYRTWIHYYSNLIL